MLAKSEFVVSLFQSDWKQLISFDCCRLTWFWHVSLPHNKENVDFVFSNFSFITYLWTSNYPPCLPQWSYDKFREPGRHFGLYKSIYRLKTVDLFFDCSRLAWFWQLTSGQRKCSFRFFQISHLDHTLQTPSYPFCLPQQTYDKFREPEGHIGLYKTVYRFSTVDLSFDWSRLTWLWHGSLPHNKENKFSDFLLFPSDA